jgi:hypothetical protein
MKRQVVATTPAEPSGVGPQSEPKGFIHAPELSRRLGVSLGTISNWRKKEDGLPHIKPPGSRLILFDWDTVREWLLRMQHGGIS